MDTAADSNPTKSKRGVLYELFMAALALLVLIALAIEVLMPIDEDVAEIIQGLDLMTCAVFLLDFLKRLIQAPSRRRYFFKELGFIDLISSIPTIDALRFTRILRVFKVVRAFRGSRFLVAFTAARAQGTFLTTAMVAIFTLFLGAIAILHAEAGVNTTLQSGGDALWWTFVTLTTGELGEVQLMTTVGRVVAAGLILVGMTLFGALTGLIAAWVLRKSDESPPPREDLESSLRELRTILEELRVREGRGLGDGSTTG